MEGLEKDAARVNLRLAELSAAASTPAPRRTARRTVEAIIEQRDELQERLASSDLPTRKAAIRAVVQEVRVRSERVRMPHTKLQREVVVPQEVTLVRLGDASSDGPEDPVSSGTVSWALGEP